MLSIKRRKTIILMMLVGSIAACNVADMDSSSTEEEANYKMVLNSEVDWTPLNPARGDNSPQAGTLWGDRMANEATGFLVRFKKGFSSPPHIHNITYRGIVIQGLIHNDDPNAEKMWMPPISYWTQPAGEGHITSAMDSNNMAYIEIEEGPYLVKPTTEAFDNGERPINVDRSNIVWVDASDISWVKTQDVNKHSPEVAFLWGNHQNDELRDVLIKLPATFEGVLKTSKGKLQAVVIKGKLQYKKGNDSKLDVLEPGSYFSSDGAYADHFLSAKDEEVILYVRTKINFDVVASK